ncbi:MAG: deiodinase family protein [Planctomycetaceae bacterium]
MHRRPQRVGRLLLLGLAAAVAPLARAEGPPEASPAAGFAEYLKTAYGDQTPPEGARMLMAILHGSRMGPGEGWFGPAQTRYSWPWLAERLGADPKAGIPRDRFGGPEDLFAVLDRNRDGVIQPTDLDWSDTNPYVQLSSALNRIFRRLDADGSGVMSRDDWQQLFDGAAGADGAMTAEEFAGALLKGEGGGFTPGDAPTTDTLLKGLFAGEIGSMEEGPNVGDPAPVFRLRAVRGEGSVAVDDLLGEKPLVLVFGNFTCGPFRAFYPAVDALRATYGDRANFLMVYVREAHPEDGWKMESNAKAGVTVVQPKSFEERVGVAGQFCQRLDPSMPVVVDDVNDSVGHAYSGMPARLYLVDADGTIAYKSGRGPFGFKPKELEQALAMHLLESSAPTPAPAAPAAEAAGAR